MDNVKKCWVDISKLQSFNSLQLSLVKNIQVNNCKKGGNRQVFDRYLPFNIVYLSVILQTMNNNSEHIMSESYEELQQKIERQMADIAAVNASEEAEEQRLEEVRRRQLPWWKRLFRR